MGGNAYAEEQNENGQGTEAATPAAEESPPAPAAAEEAATVATTTETENTVKEGV